MKNSYRDSFTTGRMRLSALALASTLTLAACGGGGGSPGTTGAAASTSTGTTGTTTTTTPVAAPTITLAFVDASGNASTTLSGATPLTARATVKDATGKAVANALVAFATDVTLGLFTPSAGTALTDANGVATVTLRPATLAANGAATLTATSTISGTTATTSANYTIGATALTFGALTASLATLPAYGSTNLSIDVLTNGAKYTAQAVNVTFTSACVTAGKASLSSSVATGGGTAQVVYRDLGCGNNDTITATSDGITGSASTTLTIAKPAAASVAFSAATPVGQSIVIAGQGGLGRTETATLTFKVFDTFGNPLVGQAVNFTSSTNLVTVNKLSDTTDALGQVTTTVNSGTTPTTFRITATLAGTSIYTTSGQISVTTGLPDQAHLSMSATVYNTDGWTYDSGTTVPASNINVLLADQNGNPVPDGTPVIFSTNLGAVGSASQGACNTLNGGCSVDFRTQNPRVASPGLPQTFCNTGTGSSPDSTRAGVATVCASTSDGKNTLFGKVAIFFGGSTAYGILNGSIPLTSNISTPYDLGTIVQTASKVFTIQFNDLNDNPMPVGSQVAVTNLANVSADAPSPALVPNVAPHSATADDLTGATISGKQGSTHTITIVPIKTDPCVPQAATFNVTLTAAPGTTRALTTTFPFKLALTCG